MSYVVDVGYALDLSQIGAAINKFKELQKEVGKTDKALNSMGKAAGSSSEAKRTKEMKDLGSAADGASKKVKQVGESAAQAGDKFDKLIEKNQLVRQYMVDGFTKGEAKILATAKQAGILESQFSSLQHTLLQVAKLSSDPFDNSRGSIRALEKDITSLRDRMELSAKGIYANTNQMRLFGRAAEEVRGEIEKLGIKLDSPAGQAEYNKRLGERREKLTALIRETNNLNEVERQAQRIAKENQRILERTASVERRVSVRQTSKEFGVNLQDASFILDAKATGNMQLYNKALESTRKTMLETIPVATTLKTLIPAIGAVGGFAFLAQATREFLKMADSMRLVEARINLVSTAGADASQVLDQLVEISKENRVNLDTTSRLYTRLVPAMESFKVNLEGSTSATDAALKVTKAFGASLLISGANTQEAIAATTQFTQAMASGKLAGDEFRSVSEAAPAFLKAIADGSGYARSELKQLSSEGKLTTELLSQALIKMLDSLQAKADKVPVTMGQAFERVKTDLMVFSRDLNESTGAVDLVVDAIETLGIVAQGAGEVLGFLRDVIDGINGPLNTLGTSFGQLVLSIGAVISISKLLTVTMGALGIAGAASTVGTALSAVVVGMRGVAGAAATAGGALVTATTAMRGYAATATAVSVAATATGALSTALLAARGAVLALGAALASTPVGLILAGLATAAGVLYFNSEQAAVQISKLAEEKEGSIKSTKVLLESEEKLAKSWDELIKKAPEVGQAIQRSLDSSGVKFLTDDQQRELEESMKRIQKLREDVSKDNLSGRERVAKNELIIVLKKEYDARYRTFALQQQIDMFNSTSDGAASDMIKKLQEEVKQREQVNKLLREGVSLRKAELIAAGMTAIQQQYGTPSIMPGEGPIQFEARKLSIKRQIAEQEATLFGYADKLTTLEKEQTAILDSQKKSKKEKTNSLLEELQALEKLLPLAKQIGDVEKARLITGGLSVEQAQRLLDLRKQNEVLENAKSREEETELVKKELELLKQGLTVEQTKAVLEQDALKRAMIAKGYSQTQFEDRVKDLALIKELTEADKERQDAIQKSQEAAQKLQETYAEFVAPEKLEIGDLFGDAAQGAGVLLNTMYDIAAQQEEIAKRKELINKSGLKEQALEKELMAIQKKQSANELANMRAVTGGAKQLFKEKSTAYKVLERLERAMFIMQLYNQKAEIAAFVTGVATKVAGYATTAIAAGKAAIASSLIAPPPANFASLAAVLAVLAGVGIAISGSRSSGSDSAPVYNEGKGTVLGDSNAQSESIKKSIEALEKYAKVELPITSAMLQSLRNIESGINGLGSLIVRSPNGTPGASLSSNVAQGTNLSSTSRDVMTVIKVVRFLVTGGISALTDALIPSVGKTFNKVIGTVVGGIFGKVSTKVIGSGLTANIQAIKDVLENGFELLEYVDIQTKKKSWLGSKSKVSTQTAQADAELSRQFSLIFENFYSTILLAAKPLGASLDVVTNLLDNFVIDIGKIQLGGKTGKEVQEALEAVFGQQADLMARFAFSSQESIRFVLNEWIWFSEQWYQYGQQFSFDEFLALPAEIQAKLKPVVESLKTPFDDFQRVGEGFFETITRVASSVERAQFAADTFRVGMIALSDVMNKQGDVAVELLRQSLIKAEKDTYGFATGVSDIVAIFDGSIDELEDMWETLTNVRENLRAAGKAFEDLSASMIAGARGFEQLQAGLEAYFEDFLDEQERYAEYSRQIKLEFDSLNLAVPESIQQFKELVNGIDTTTTEGQKLFGAVIALTPAFKQLTEAADELEEIWEVPTGVRENLRAAGKAFEDLSASMIAGAKGSEALQSGLKTYFDGFLSDQERYQELLRQMTSEFKALNLSVPRSVDEFKSLVEGIDTTTTEGQKLFGAVIALTPAFKQLTEAVDKAKESQIKGLRDLVSAAQSLFDKAVGDLKAAYDREKSELEKTINDFSRFIEALKKFRDELTRGSQAMLSPKSQLEENRKAFEETAKRALGGDEEALGEIEQVGKEYLDASSNYYASSGKYFEDLESVKNVVDGALALSKNKKTDAEKQLELLTEQVGALITLNESVLSVKEAIENFKEAQEKLEAEKINLLKQQVSIALNSSNVKELAKIIVDNFSLIDKNLDSLLTFSELQDALKGKATDGQIRALITLMDTDLDGVISAIEAQTASELSNNDLIVQGILNLIKVSATGLTYEKLVSALGSVIDPTELSRLFDRIDRNFDGLITSYEIGIYSLLNSFSLIDKNLDSLLTFSELQDALKGVATDAQIRAMIIMLDTNLDGIISALEAQTASELSNNDLIVQGLLNLIKVSATGLTYEELVSALGSVIDEKELSRLFDRIDRNFDGLITSFEVAIDKLISANNVTAAIIEKSYQELFNRSADAEGLEYWMGQLSSGMLNLQQLQEAMVSGALGNDKGTVVTPRQSNEDLVRLIYQSLGIREDAAGINYWVGELNSGKLNSGNIAEAIRNAQMISQSQGSTGTNKTTSTTNQGSTGTNKTPSPTPQPKSPSPVVTPRKVYEDLVRQIYQTLGIEQDDAGINYWVGELSSGKLNSDNIAEAIENAWKSRPYQSKGDYLADRIALAYEGGQGGRKADQAGVDYWTNQVKSGALTLIQVIHSIETAKKQGNFFTGGYTGPGGVFDPAGVVHKGEVVFSQADVRRWGGWQAVEMLRLMGPSNLDSANEPVFNRAGRPSSQSSSSTIDNSPIVFAINETSRHTAALVTLQQAANRKIIEKLSDMEERLGGIESKARLEASK